MSQENLETVQRALGAVFAHPKPDYETVNALYSEEHVFVPAGVASGLETAASGAEGFRAWREELASLGAAEHELMGAVDLGPEKVLAVVLSRFEGRTSGAVAGLRTWNVITVRSGKLVRTEAFTEPKDALAACMRE